MRVAVLCCVLSAVLGAAFVAPAPASAGEAKILQYDKNGRVIGIRRVETKDGQTGAWRSGGGGIGNSDTGSSVAGVGAGTGAGGPGTPVTAPGNRYVKGEVIVVNPPARFEASVGSLGFSVIERIALNALSLRVLRVRLPRGTTVPAAVRLLATRFPGLIVDANHIYDPSGTFLDVQAGSFLETHARAAIGWRRPDASCGAGVRIGMIDAAVDVKHPALAGQKVLYRSFHKAGRDPGPADHGTAVAAMLVGAPDWGGLLPGAELVAANMFEINESGRKVGNAVGLMKAINWMVKSRVHVLNLSVAGADNKILRRVFERAHQRDLVMVAAAGNWGVGAEPAYPAAYEYVVAVTAFGERRVVYNYANRGPYIDFAAPGVSIWTAVPGGGRMQSGTSFASPYITVMVGLQVAHGSGKNPNVLRKILRRYTVDLGAPGRDDVFGWGFVDLPPKCRAQG